MWPFGRKKVDSEFRRNLRILEEHIEKLSQKGLNNDAIVRNLAGAGWKHQTVDLVMHDLHKPDSSIEKLQQYIIRQRQRAVTPEEIKESLMEAGWSEDIIDVALGL